MRMLHTMLRVGDLQRSIDFYTRVLGMQLLRTTDRPDQKYALAFVGYDKNAVEFEETETKQDDEKSKLKKLLNMSVNEIELSVRAANCLNNANITTVGQLAMKSEAEMLKYRNFGKKSLNEIKDKLQALGLTLGMTFDSGLLDAPKEDKAAV